MHSINVLHLLFWIEHVTIFALLGAFGGTLIGFILGQPVRVRITIFIGILMSAFAMILSCALLGWVTLFAYGDATGVAGTFVTRSVIALGVIFGALSLAYRRPARTQ